MNIKKNWFYLMSEISDEKIIIADNLEVVLFDDGLQNRIVSIGENSKVQSFGVLEKKDDYNITFTQKSQWSSFIARYLLLSKNNLLKVKIFSDLEADDTSSDVKIISIIWNEGSVDLDGIIKIGQWISWVKAKLIEENLFLWSTGKAKWIPTLLVRSNDVEASHACKMERISDEKLFYLRSRWVWKENAIHMMVESYITDLLSWLRVSNWELYEYLIWEIQKQI